MRRTHEIAESKDLTRWQKYLAKVLSMGPVPNHVAFIVDGSRRWARERQLETIKGHHVGAQNGEIIAKFVQALGAKEMTMYAFSIENFKRPPEEVDALMKLLDNVLFDLLQELPDACFRVIGDKSLLNKAIQEKIAVLEERTRNNPGIVLNIALAYTCRDDITHGMKKVLTLDAENQNFSVEGIRDSMYTKDTSDVDVLVRTSGETRLSDFLMWEVSVAVSGILPYKKLYQKCLFILDMQRVALLYRQFVARFISLGYDNVHPQIPADVL